MKINHIAIAVDNVEEACKKYQEALDDYDRAIEIELPRGLTRKSKYTSVSYELDKMREERKELLKGLD